MRVGLKIALVGGVPILVASAIAVAGWLLLAQEERARGGAVLAGQVFHDLNVARIVRDDYVTAPAPERSAFAERFASLTAEAGRDLGTLKSLAQTGDQTARVASVEAALARYVARMDDFTRVSRENDGLIAEMAQRATTLIELADRARLRQQASNADLVRSLGEKVGRLRATHGVLAGLAALKAAADDTSATAAPDRLKAAIRSLERLLRDAGHDHEADDLDALTAGDAASPDADGKRANAPLSAWADRRLTADAASQQTVQDEIARLLTYSTEANEIEQATQNIAIATLRLGQRTADALGRRDTASASGMIAQGGELSTKAAALPISPLIQAEMIDAVDGWRERLATTIDGLGRQNAMIAEMDGLAATMSDSARALNDAFIGDADGFGAFIRQVLLFGAGGGLLLGSLVAYVVARSILVPLRRIQRNMIALAARPEEGAISGTRRRDELGDIARATNFFVSEIARRERALRRAKDQADAALDSLRQTQDDLIRAEKLASLGELVAGVAHEINTPLGIALTTATLVRDEARDFQAVAASGQLSRSRLSHFVERVGEGAQLLCANLGRAADLVHGFKQVAVDRVSDERRSVDLATWLDELVASLQPMLRKGSHEIWHTCPAGIVVDTNPGALAQIATNLITNAVVHGFGKSRGGRVTVRIEPAPGGMLRLEIADDGAGIAPENLGRIFDPFFTTARNRGSTGLGMHIVHNLVTAKLQGRIGIESEPGKGTVVRVEFPVGERVAQPEIRSRTA